MSSKMLKTQEFMPSDPQTADLVMGFDDESIAGKVAEMAYFKAEKRGFEPGFEMEDWLEAEKEVMAGLQSR